MKKILFSCLMAIGFCANAQIFVSESFEGSLPNTFAGTGGYTGSIGTYTITGGACDGTSEYGAEMYGGGGGGRNFSLTYTDSTGSNGKAIDYSYLWTTLDYDTTAGGVTGTITTSYSINSAAFVTLSSTTISSPLTCQLISGTIPNGIAVAGQSFRFKITVTTTNNAAAQNDFYFFVDSFKLKQVVTSVPSCTTFTTPANASTNVSVRPTLNWGAVAGASSYKLAIGTSSGASDFLSTSLTGTSYTLAGTNLLAPNTKYFANITPNNDLGDASGCVSEISFTTGSNPYAPYCGPLVASATVYPISSVNLNGVTNTSSAATGSPAQEDFTSNTPIDVVQGTTYPITIVGTGAGTTNRFGTTVFIDWNHNGTFEPEESYFTTTPFLGAAGATTNTLTGNIAVPSTAISGATRMRVKYNYNSSTTALTTALSDPCGDLGNGQAEEYTLNVTSTLGTAIANKKDLTIYPNPFQDILKISDVKEVKSISVNDLSGKLIKTLTPTSELNLSHLQSGMYIVTLQMKDGSIKSFKTLKK